MATNGKAITEKEWAKTKDQLNEIIHLFGGLMFLPAFIIVGIAHGLREGIIAGAYRTLTMFKDWGKE